MYDSIVQTNYDIRSGRGLEPILKPCPFCGVSPKLRFTGGNINKWIVECDNNRCKIQPMTDYHKLKWVVIREWNYRRDN